MRRAIDIRDNDKIGGHLTGTGASGDGATRDLGNAAIDKLNHQFDLLAPDKDCSRNFFWVAQPFNLLGEVGRCFAGEGSLCCQTPVLVIPTCAANQPASDAPSEIKIRDRSIAADL